MALACALATGAFAVLPSCTLDARDLAAFQETASGPDKLRAILRSSDRPAQLRAQAALSLFDLPRKDVDGRALLFEELNALDAHGRNAIVPTFQQGLSQRMHTERGQAPSDAAVLAKDAGAELLAMLGQRERGELGGELLSWLAEDIPHRAESGRFALEALADEVGPEGALPLVLALNAAHDPRSLARLAAIIDKHAEPAVRTAAAARIVELARAYRRRTDLSAAQHVRAQLDHILPALGRFADQALVRARLIELASAPDVALEEQARALELLASRVTQDELAPLLLLAQSDQAAPELRVSALSRVGEIGSRDALPALLVLLTDRNHGALRKRAGELLLELGGLPVVSSFFRSLPAGWGLSYDRAEIDAYAERLSLLKADNALLMLLGEKLHSSFWWNRVLALRYFASRGTAEDVWRIRQHLHDAQPILGPGWPRGYTVGQEAESSLNLALQRHARAKARPSRPEELSE